MEASGESYGGGRQQLEEKRALWSGVYTTAGASSLPTVGLVLGATNGRMTLTASSFRGMFHTWIL
jgi:hypothetical protein